MLLFLQKETNHSTGSTTIHIFLQTVSLELKTETKHGRACFSRSLDRLLSSEDARVLPRDVLLVSRKQRRLLFNNYRRTPWTELERGCEICLPLVSCCLTGPANKLPPKQIRIVISISGHSYILQHFELVYPVLFTIYLF